jgi:glycosyltransferase involved in cell wall biosynthesis
MRILLVMGSYYPELQFGGSTQKLYELSVGLVERGHDVQVLTFHSDRSVPHPPLVVRGVKVNYLSWVGSGSWRVPINLKSLFRLIRWSDVVHCFGIYSLLCSLATAVAKRTGRPYLLEPMGMYPPRGRSLAVKRIYNLLSTGAMMKGAKTIIATSQTELDGLARAIPHKRLELRRDGIKVEMFASLPDGKSFRDRLGISASEKVILYVGRISRIKNLEQLVQAFKMLARPATKLVLLGPTDEPDYLARLKVLIAGNGLAGEVIFAGALYEAEKLPAFAAADLLVLPSEFESYGLAAAEGVAAGIPVLITDTCGIAPLIHRRAGLSVPVNIQSLADGMRVLLGDEAQRRKFTSARCEVLKELTWEKPLSQLEQLYQHATHNRQGRRFGGPLSATVGPGSSGN